MSDSQQEPATDSESESSRSQSSTPESPSEAEVEVVKELLGEQVATRSINVLGFQPVSPDDAPDVGGLPPADQAEPPSDLQTPADSAAQTEE
jgi:hypothetical protein